MRVRILLAALLLVASCKSGSTPPPTDGGLDADSSLDASPQTCPSPSLSPDTCAAYATPVTAIGVTPFGTIALTSASVTYVQGFLTGTNIAIEGTIAGAPVRLSALQLLFDANPVAPVGTYSTSATDASTGGLNVTLEGCEPLSSATLTITRHETAYPPSPAPGATANLEARLVITDPGWNLDVTFHVDAACGSTTSD